MSEVLSIGILDYTPLEYKRYDGELAARVLSSALRESAPENVNPVSLYIRAFREEIPDMAFDMFVISGSPLSTIGYSKDLEKAISQISRIIDKVPVFGICFGLHAIAKITGNGSKMIEEFEMGPRDVAFYSEIDGVRKKLHRSYPRFPMNHFCKISNGNKTMKVIAVSDKGGIQIADATESFNGNPVMGVQFHPEFAASRPGWHAFRKIFEKTLEAVISGEYPEATIWPILDALPKPAKDGLKRNIYTPENLVGSQLTKKQKDLFMSLFHNIDYRTKLLGKAESSAIYDELKANSQAVISHFLKKAIKAKERRRVSKVKSGTTIALNTRH